MAVKGSPCPLIENGAVCGKPIMGRGWCSMHYGRWVRTGDPMKVGKKGPPYVPPIIRFMIKVDTNGPVAKNCPWLGRCWIWIGARNTDGRGSFSVGGRGASRHQAHRWLWQEMFGPVPAGLELDHFACDNGAGGCVSPWHVRPVTGYENIMRSSSPSALNARKTHCINGHEFTPENTYLYTNPKWVTGAAPHRRCNTCMNERRRRKRAKPKSCD